MNRYTYSCGHKEEIYPKLEVGTILYCNECKDNVSIKEVEA